MTKTGDAIEDARQWAREWRHEADIVARDREGSTLAARFRFAAIALEEFAKHLEDQQRLVKR